MAGKNDPEDYGSEPYTDFYDAFRYHVTAMKQPKKIVQAKPFLLLPKVAPPAKPPPASYNDDYLDSLLAPPKAKLSDVENPKKNPDKPMSIGDALKALDDACDLYWNPEIQSVVYPGLTALQAIAYVSEIIIESAKVNKPETLLHPAVAARVRQVCANAIGTGKGPDPSIAAVYRLAADPPNPVKSKLRPFERKFS